MLEIMLQKWYLEKLSNLPPYIVQWANPAKLVYNLPHRRSDFPRSHLSGVAKKIEISGYALMVLFCLGSSSMMVRQSQWSSDRVEHKQIYSTIVIKVCYCCKVVICCSFVIIIPIGILIKSTSINTKKQYIRIIGNKYSINFFLQGGMANHMCQLRHDNSQTLHVAFRILDQFYLWFLHD